jgi:hypothetical protein
VSSSLLWLDSDAAGIENVFDAAYAAYYAHAMYSNVSLTTVWEAIRNSVAYRLRSLRKGPRFPPESEWAGPD